jgi:hypothetical protein
MTSANNHTDTATLTFKNDAGETLSLVCVVDNMLASHKRAILSVQLPDGQEGHITLEDGVKFITFNDQKWTLID